MMDQRESILERIKEIGISQAGFTSAVRNRGLRTNEKRPAIILLDGDEAPVLTHGGRNNRAKAGRMMSLTPQVMAMTPQLFILMEEREQTDEELGTDLNQKRVLLIKGIAEDEQLQQLLGSNGGIVYNGCVTDLKSGLALSGQMRLDFIYTYTFFPTTNDQGAS